MSPKERKIEVEDQELEAVGHEEHDQLDDDPVARLQAERDEFHDKYQRALADFQNFRRRASQNEIEARRGGGADVLQSVLSIVDYFDLALKQDPESVNANTILQGVEMIKGELLRAVAQHGVETNTPAVGDLFDPLTHEAVEQVETEDVEPGCVARVVQPGYVMGDRVLRAAKVVVAGAAESQEDAGTGDASTEG